MTRLVVVGAGGFGRETLDVVAAINRIEHRYDLVGVIDDAPSAINLTRLEARAVRYLGSLESWMENDRQASVALAVGSPRIRQRLVNQLMHLGLQHETLIHPLAGVGTVAGVGQGTIVCAGAQISTNVRLGQFCHINPNATIGHDSVLNDYVSVNPGAVVSGECVIGEASLIGAGAVVLQGLTIGRCSVIGAAACVTREVAANTTVRGVPAR